MAFHIFSCNLCAVGLFPDVVGGCHITAEEVDVMIKQWVISFSSLSSEPPPPTVITETIQLLSINTIQLWINLKVIGQTRCKCQPQVAHICEHNRTLCSSRCKTSPSTRTVRFISCFIIFVVLPWKGQMASTSTWIHQHYKFTT